MYLCLYVCQKWQRHNRQQEKKKKTIKGDFCGGERENKINQEQSMLQTTKNFLFYILNNNFYTEIIINSKYEMKNLG